jgi:membrane-associated phospholipid phosphatase
MLRERSRVAGITMAGFVTFVALTTYVADRSLPPAPITRIDRWLRAYPGSLRYTLAENVNGLGGAATLAVLCVLVAACARFVLRRQDLAVLAVVAPLLAGLAQVLTRLAIERPLSHAGELMGAHGHGFPSGHTTGTAALATVVILGARLLSEPVRQSVTAGAIGFALAVAVSCVVTGAHRGLDVVGGLLLGPLVVLALVWSTSGIITDQSWARVGVKRRHTARIR